MARRTQTPEERFWAKVEKTPTCWLWTANLSTDGYGWFQLRTRKAALAHRVAYEVVVGPIPDGLTLDHLCRVRHCVNPAHLEPVTLKENIRRRTGVTETHCAKGHEFTPENTQVGTMHGGRYQYRRCRTCSQQRERERYLRDKAVTP